MWKNFCGTYSAVTQEVGENSPILYLRYVEQAQPPLLTLLCILDGSEYSICMRHREHRGSRCQSRLELLHYLIALNN